MKCSNFIIYLKTTQLFILSGVTARLRLLPADVRRTATLPATTPQIISHLQTRYNQTQWGEDTKHYPTLRGEN